MVCAMRWITWRTETSWPVPGTPALRKYLETTMSVASWLQSSGTSALSSSNTTAPLGSRMTDLRRAHRTASSGGVPSLVKWRRKASPLRWCFGDFSAFTGLRMVSSMAILPLPGSRRPRMDDAGSWQRNAAYVTSLT